MAIARSVLALALALALSAAAHADPEPDPKARAAKLFEEGRAYAKAGDYAKACDRFDKSYALEPAAGTEMNLADCAERAGKLRKAWRLFDAAATELDRTSDPRAAFARQRADKLVAQLVTVIVQIAKPLPAGLAITIDKHSEPATAEVRDVVDPGPIEVVATAPDHAAATRTARGEAGGTVRIEIALAADGESHEPPGDAHRRKSWVLAAIGIGGAGAVAELASLGFGLAARSDHQAVLDDGSCGPVQAGLQCSADGTARENHAGKLADIATAFAIGGGALLVTGAILYFAAPVDAPPARDAMRIVPLVDPHAVGVGLAGAF